jgi:hypothetical protein
MSWHKIIQNHIDKIITDKEFNELKDTYDHCPPQLEESYYDRKVFDSFFPNQHKLIPHFWMPEWTNVADPSPRELEEYSEYKC